MKRLTTYISLFLLLIISITHGSIYAEDTGKLLEIPGSKNGEYQWGDFKYLGAFRLPKTLKGGVYGLSYGGYVIAFNPPSSSENSSTKQWGSLFITGNPYEQLTAEINIPEIIECEGPEIGIIEIGTDKLEIVKCKNSGGYTVDKLTTATEKQPLTDTTEVNGISYRTKILADETKDIANGARIGGLIPWRYKDKNWLIGSVYGSYDAANQAVKSHFATSQDLLSSSQHFTGMRELGKKPSPVPGAGFIGGYMTLIPQQWQQGKNDLGGKALSGMSGLSGSNISSYGPAAFSFDPDDIIEKKSPNDMEVHALLYYDIAHQTLGEWSAADYKPGNLHKQGTTHAGVIFPAGTRSIIFTGRFPEGVPCYGIGTNIKEEDGNTSDQAPPNNTCMRTILVDKGVTCCYDPTNSSKGPHGYPYVMYAWAYDASDLKEVVNGNKKPWEVVPYDHGEIKLPFTDTNSSGVQGATAYDEESKRLYLVQVKADNEWPIIHVFQIKIDSAPKINKINLVQ